MGMTAAPSNGGRGRSTPNINITPLVDVVLVVLIIFMIVTLTMTKTFWLNLPPKADTKEAPEPTDDKPLVMTVDRAGVIRVNTTVLQKQEIARRLPRMMAGTSQKVLYFDAADETTYAVAMEAMDLSRASGVKSIAILTEKIAK
jgi:biopolymer transport protein ExbD/biopolymer transport protein TolR